jgi:type I restriction-modification system DNA methylase subunit
MTHSVSALESLLWEAANILRGPVDAADFKTYVFPLLFFKRISDVYDEEYTAALTESGGDEGLRQVVDYIDLHYASVVVPNTHDCGTRSVYAIWIVFAQRRPSAMGGQD